MAGVLCCDCVNNMRLANEDMLASMREVGCRLQACELQQLCSTVLLYLRS